jgi:hypothetical protein
VVESLHESVRLEHLRRNLFWQARHAQRRLRQSPQRARKAGAAVCTARGTRAPQRHARRATPASAGCASGSLPACTRGKGELNMRSVRGGGGAAAGRQPTCIELHLARLQLLHLYPQRVAVRDALRA